MSTTIEWTQRPGTKGETWNPIRAENTENGKIGHFCEKVSGGCKNCYASTWNARGMSPAGNGLLYTIENKPKVRFFLDGETLTQPLHWRNPRTMFVESMSDLFGEWVDNQWLDEIHGIILACEVFDNFHHTFIALTKRAKEMADYYASRSPAEHLKAWAKAVRGVACPVNEDETLEDVVYGLTCFDWDTEGRNSSGSEHRPWGYTSKMFPLPNLWLGVSIEDQQRADERIPHLQNTPAAVRFVSYEPALGPVDWMYPKSLWPDGPLMCCNGLECGCHGLPVDPPLIHGIDWLIIGGESGPGARPFNLEWARQTIRDCSAAGTKCFVKQLGSHAIADTEKGLQFRYTGGGSRKWGKGKDPEEWPADLRVREFPQ